MDLKVAEKLAEEKILFWLGKTWNFRFHDQKRAMGTCDENRKIIFLSKTYTLGRPEAEVLNTILHEIAHGIAGCMNGHNSVWKAACVRVGARPERVGNHDMTLAEQGIKWVCVDPSGNICKSWFRKPAKTTFAKLPNMFIPGNEEATLGKLTIIPYKA